MQPSTLASLEAYRTDGRHPGGFLTYCLENDLVNAIGSADDESLKELPEIAAYIWNKLPRSVWGSCLIVEGYMNQCDAEREQANEDASAGQLGLPSVKLAETA